MRHLRLPAVLTALVAVSALFVSACLPQTWVGWQYTPVRGYTELTPQQLGAYVEYTYWRNGGKVSGCHYPSVLPHPKTLAAYYTEEGNHQYIRGDIAFAQSILETGWFGFCGSQVHPTDFNFAGIGAHDNGQHPIAKFATPRLGVRAQMQRLNRYANPAGAESLAFPLVAQKGWATASQYNNWWPGVQGTKTTWQSLTGTWASSPCYDTRVMRIYNQMRTHYGLAPMPVQAKPGC